MVTATNHENHMINHPHVYQGGLSPHPHNSSTSQTLTTQPSPDCVSCTWEGRSRQGIVYCQWLGCCWVRNVLSHSLCAVHSIRRVETQWGTTEQEHMLLGQVHMILSSVEGKSKPIWGCVIYVSPSNRKMPISIDVNRVHA